MATARAGLHMTKQSHTGQEPLLRPSLVTAKLSRQDLDSLARNLPKGALQFFRTRARRYGHGIGFPIVCDICNDAGVPHRGTPPDWVHGSARQRWLMAHIRTEHV
jgi:hypothetical protein